jgi:hypothetical protein
MGNTKSDNYKPTNNIKENNDTQKKLMLYFMKIWNK